MARPRIPLLFRRVFWPLLLLGLVTALVRLLPRFGLATTVLQTDPATRAQVARNYGAVAIGIAAALVFVRLLDYVVFDLAFRFRRRAPAPAVLRQLIALLAFGLSVSLLFKLGLGMSLTAVITTSAILTAVIGLALQDTLGNLFAGLSLQFERTIQVGDMVRSGDTVGIVEQLSWRAIRLRTLEGNLLVVPNSVAGRERLDVYPRPGRPIARKLRVGLDYDVSPGKARQVLEKAARDLPGVAEYPAPVVYLQSFDDHATAYELRYWLEDYARYLEIDSQVRERAWYALERAGLRFAYPVIRQHQFSAGPLLAQPLPGDALSVLGRAELFGPLSTDEKQRLADLARERRYGPDEVIVREGETGSSMFLVESGRVGVSIHGAGGDSRKLAFLERGAAFGEISLLTGEPRTATVRALTESWLVEIGKDCLAPILEANPSLVGALEATIRERRLAAAQLFDASREEMAREAEDLALGARIARFFGIYH